ncbi:MULTISPECIES: hypothetical protein [Actinoplanes]|uniref:hypothetical protein n=1 Tax=Actinoplanes TaxID=1865 RepID=UPI0005F2865A|nr:MULTISPECIES: hypothetical protein [Actinoplanes]GLY06748.1 hypothetical protein Acsp01_71270 [Actinoplanes sp. NBRC 101535]
MGAAGIYFSSSDDTIEHEITDRAFDDSLVFNLLFEPSLTVTDVFFFNNRHLIRHIEQGGDDGLFLRAVGAGRIVPAFRYASDHSFRDALASIVSTDRARDIQEEKYTTTSPPVLAMRLDEAYRRNGNPARRVWPDDMGTLFGVEIERVLRDDEPRVDEALAARWHDIRRWRHESTGLSRAATARLGGTGVRRHEMWNAVGRSEGWLDDGHSFALPSDLVDAAHRAGGPELRANAQLFVDAVNITYERFQAHHFGARHNIPSALMANAEVVVGNLDVPTAAPAAGFSMDLRLPETGALLAAGGADLLAVAAEKGGEYFRRRDEWSAYPSARTEEQLRAAVTAYADDLLTWSRGRQRPARFSTFLHRINPITAHVAGGVGTIAGNALGLPPEYAIVSGLVTATATHGLTTAFEILGGRRRRVSTGARTLTVERTLPR